MGLNMKKILRSLNGEVSFPPPIWMMRQAGRYLPEYREIRKKAGSFLNLCYSPELAIEVTMQPIRRFDFDAAILFSDILVIPDALGQNIDFQEGRGPILEPVDVKKIRSLNTENFLNHLNPVFEAVSGIRSELSDDKTLIGFCGAPWTVATYMIAGHSTPDQAPARIFSMKEPEAFRQLIDILVDTSSQYLIEQINAGADCVQIFDTWSGVLGEQDFIDFCVKPMRRIVASVKAVKPDVKIIGFPKGAGVKTVSYIKETGVDAIGIDWTTPLAFIRDEIQPIVCVQGNLDPLLLIGDSNRLRDQVQMICETLKHGPHIFNLGHGITPPTPIENVELMIETVRSYK